LEEGFIGKIGHTGMAWYRGGWFWPDWNGLEWRKLVLASLKWLGMKEDGFGLTGMAWNGGSRFWLDWNGLQ
jgi:hypothetical protein